MRISINHQASTGESIFSAICTFFRWGTDWQPLTLLLNCSARLWSVWQAALHCRQPHWAALSCRWEDMDSWWASMWILAKTKGVVEVLTLGMASWICIDFFDHLQTPKPSRSTAWRHLSLVDFKLKYNGYWIPYEIYLATPGGPIQ